MGECIFRIFRKLLCTTLILSLLWPDLAKCMEDEEENFNYPSNLLQNNTSDQKGDLQSIDQKESLSSIILKKDTTFSEDPKTMVNQEILLNTQENDDSLSEKKEVTETTPLSQDVTNTDKNSRTKNVIETNIVPIEDEFSEEKPSENKAGDNNNSSFQELKNKEKKEEGGFGGKTVNFFESVEEEDRNNPKVSLFIDEEEEEELSETTKSFLAYFKKRIIDGWPTWKQVVGAIGGAAIGVGVGYGMAVIFFGEIFSGECGSPNPIIPKILYDFLRSFANSNDATLSLICIVSIASGLDAIMRDSSALMSVFGSAGHATFLNQIKLYKKRLIATKISFHVASFISSSLPIYYLYVINFPALNPSAKSWVPLAISQIIDTSLAYGNSLSDRAEKWVKKKTLSSRSKEEKIETQRQFYVDILKKLMWILYKLPDEQIKELYEEVFQKIEKGEVSEALKALKVLEALLKVYESYEGEDPILSQQAKKKQASILGWIVSSFASPGRHVVFWYSVYSIIQNLYILDNDSSGSNVPSEFSDSIMWPLSILLGGIIGALVQGYFEKENLGKSYFNITRGQTVTEPQCWWPIRIINKAWDYLIQGPFYTIPYVLAFFEIFSTCTNSFPFPSHCSLNAPLPLLITMLIPFFLADAFNNATYFNESSGKWISAINRLLSYTPLAKYLKGYKRDKLIEITNSFRNLMRDLTPEVVKELNTYFLKKIPNLFRSRTNEENLSEKDSKTEEHEPLLKSKKEITFYDHGSIDDMILSNNHLLFKEQKGSMFSSCWRGLGKCYQKIPSLNTCWKGVKKGFTFLFSSCCKGSKEREMEDYTEEDEREKLIN